MFNKNYFLATLILLSLKSFAAEAVPAQAFFCAGAATSVYHLTTRFGATQSDLTAAKGEKDYLKVIESDKEQIARFAKNNELFTKRLINFSSSKMDVIRFFKFSPLIDQTMVKLKAIEAKKSGAQDRAKEYRNAAIDFYLAARMLFETECGPYKPEIIL